MKCMNNIWLFLIWSFTLIRMLEQKTVCFHCLSLRTSSLLPKLSLKTFPKSSGSWAKTLKVRAMPLQNLKKLTMPCIFFWLLLLFVWLYFKQLAIVLSSCNHCTSLCINQLSFLLLHCFIVCFGILVLWWLCFVVHISQWSTFSRLGKLQPCDVTLIRI